MKLKPQGSILPYSVGFGLSIIFTLAAFWAVQIHLDSHHTFPTDTVLIAIITSLAVVQLVVQLVFFLHMGSEKRPRWNLAAFVFMLLVLVILVFGSLWIMNNLNYHMTPSQTNDYIIQDEGIHK